MPGGGSLYDAGARTMSMSNVKASAAVAMLLCLWPSFGGAAEAPGPQIGEVQVRTLAPVTVAVIETETTFGRLGEAIGAAMPKIENAAKEGKITVAGPFVLRYPKGSAHATPDKPFNVEIGMIVADGAQPAGEVKVRKLEGFRAATVLYTGPVTGIGQCYQKLFPTIERLGLEPSGEEREFTLYFESVESANNVMMVQLGVRDKKAAAAKPPDVE
jgi:effector-binding domain-containing protein